MATNSNLKGNISTPYVCQFSNQDVYIFEHMTDFIIAFFQTNSQSAEDVRA